MSEDPEEELGFEVIIGCTRAQALDEGILVDVSSMARELGFKISVAVTCAVWNSYVMLTAAAQQACNDERGRLWDILWMFRDAIARDPNASEVEFSLYVVTESVEPSLVKLKGVCGPGDNAEPVLTIMLPEE
ncbi:MAG TPA: DUF6573 family protein, partial [Candidatus Nanopelagicales bacterium]|nr:DUF6573 family protein [Candidatus Nanopelagicales bacterium]